jgi:hypothetical protein
MCGDLAGEDGKRLRTGEIEVGGEMRLHLIWFAAGVDVPGWLDHAPLSLEELRNVLSLIGEAGDCFGRDWRGGFASFLGFHSRFFPMSSASRYSWAAGSVRIFSQF